VKRDYREEVTCSPSRLCSSLTRRSIYGILESRSGPCNPLVRNPLSICESLVVGARECATVGCCDARLHVPASPVHFPSARGTCDEAHYVVGPFVCGTVPLV
jgi:hypothetical protein